MLDARGAVWHPDGCLESEQMVLSTRGGTGPNQGGIRGSHMTKSELIMRLAERNEHLLQQEVERIVSTIFDEIGAALERGDRVELRGFGTFSVKRRPPRIGRNPRTGETVHIEEKHYPFFKTGEQLRKRLNRR